MLNLAGPICEPVSASTIIESRTPAVLLLAERLDAGAFLVRINRDVASYGSSVRILAPVLMSDCFNGVWRHRIYNCWWIELLVGKTCLGQIWSNEFVGAAVHGRELRTGTQKVAALHVGIAATVHTNYRHNLLAHGALAGIKIRRAGGSCTRSGEAACLLADVVLDATQDFGMPKSLIY
jgi:hypothetical protein